jgi:uncharacterized protein VirK/YbjX
MNTSITLRSGLRAELAGLAYLRESFKLTARALLYRRQTARWLQLLNSHPLFGQMLPSCPRLVNKIYRSYFSIGLRCEDRLDLLHTHYGMVIRNGLAPLVARAARQPVPLCCLQSRSPDGDYRLELRAGGVLCREGDLVLQRSASAACRARPAAAARRRCAAPPATCMACVRKTCWCGWCASSAMISAAPSWCWSVTATGW